MAIWRVENLEQLDAETLDSLNRRLRAGETKLDWSSVTTFPPDKQLARLLAGVNISKHSDSLGIETVPEFLYETLREILSIGSAQGPQPRIDFGGKYQKPLLWPDGQAFDEEATEIKKISSSQNMADLVLPRDDPSRPNSSGPKKTNGRNANGGVPTPNLPGRNYEQEMREARARIVLDMKELMISFNPAKLPNKLQPLIVAYKLWIEEQDRLLRPSTSGYRLVRAQEAQSRLQAYYKTLARLEEGVNLLRRSPAAAQAFTFMNRAMWLQHIHYLYTQEKQRNNGVDPQSVNLPKNHSWELFQLAFILLTLPALTDLHHLDSGEEGNGVADLLWSLPGADKTDVYLGLIAYDLAMRRLQGYVGGRSSENGIAVLLRYVQLSQEQLQRVYTLLCACETIRRGEGKQWGESPFRLGLWTEATSAASELEDGMSVTLKKQDLLRIAEKPLTINRCPWCGEAIVGKGETRYCSDPSERCLFGKRRLQDSGLPALLLDEEIFRVSPSVLIATTDTFVDGPWKEETRILFGQLEKKPGAQGASRASSQNTRGVFFRPPDLVLQDDLEQISGHPGSQAGQAIIDHLSSWKIDEIKVRPKVVAALPEFRQPSQETRAILPMREINVFPPQGRNLEENFFFS